MILALRRFISCRGIPRLFISNNFKTFESFDVKRFCSTKEVVWKFILERSPQWRGFYGRLTSIVKSFLKKVESVFILFRVVYRIDSDRKYIEFAPTDIFK